MNSLRGIIRRLSYSIAEITETAREGCATRPSDEVEGVVGEAMGLAAGIWMILDRRSTDHRWIYILLAVVIFPLTLWSMEESTWGVIPCAIVLGVLAAQFLRPSLLGWITLIALFSAYGIMMVSHATRDDYLFGSAFGFLPVLGLLWAHPRKTIRSDPQA